MRTKGLPEVDTDVARIIKKISGTADGQHTGLVEALPIQGIERAQLSAAQRKRPELKAIWVEKHAETKTVQTEFLF